MFGMNSIFGYKRLKIAKLFTLTRSKIWGLGDYRPGWHQPYSDATVPYYFYVGLDTEIKCCWPYHFCLLS